jgi:uncharacterized protein YyaL (SSP411 family)
MLAPFAEAGRLLNRPDYTAVAVANASFLYGVMRGENGRLFRTWKAGAQPKYNGYLEDYAYLADGLLALYHTTFDERWYSWARELAELMLAHFADEAGGFYDTSDDHEALIHRPKDVQDNAVPSANAMAAGVLLRLGLYEGNGRYWDTAERAIASLYEPMAKYPTGFAQWLAAAAFVMGNPQELAIAGDPDSASTKDLITTAFAAYRPNLVVAVGQQGDTIPLLAGRTLQNGQATAYLCQRFVCQRPVGTPAALATQLVRPSMA